MNTTTTATTTYENSPAWRKQMAFLPAELHLITAETMPSESTWDYKGHAVHVDSCGDPATSPITLIMLHGTCVWADFNKKQSCQPSPSFAVPASHPMRPSP
jgi:hypothetical protein